MNIYNKIEEGGNSPISEPLRRPSTEPGTVYNRYSVNADISEQRDVKQDKEEHISQEF